MDSKATGSVSDLIAGWRTLSDWERGLRPSPRKWNSLVDKLYMLADTIVADPAVVAELRLIAAEDTDPSVRRRARESISPYVPRPDSEADLSRWLSHPLINVASVDLQPRISFGLVPQDVPDDSPELNDYELACLTWLRGAPVTAGGQSWPRRSDGLALAHLVQAKIGNQPLLRPRYPGFPELGVLQFFHDLRTAGRDPHDEERGAWHVRLLTEHSEQLLSRPDDLDDDAYGSRWWAEADPVWTFPSSGDLDLDPAVADRLDTANQRVRETLHAQWGARETAGPTPEYPIVLGYGRESARDVAELLHQARPPRSADDHHVLLLTVPGNGPFDGWLGDARSLEFWIRDSDLHNNAFDHAWALLR